MGLSLEKKTEIVRLVLEKRKVPENVILQVKSCLDVSVSFKPMYVAGHIQELVDRLLAVAVRFDDNKSIESYAFGDRCHRLSDITPDMFGGYIDKVFLPEAKRTGDLWSGTKYSHAFAMIIEEIKEKPVNKAVSFFSGLFGKKQEAEQAPAPSYLKFITDGETNYDEREAEMYIQQMADMRIYVQLIGVGRANFSFLKKMDEKYDHVGFVTFPNLEKTTDEELYNSLLSEELCTWIKKQ